MFFKVINPTTLEKVMKMDTRLPLRYGEDDDILLTVQTQNVNSVIQLERSNLYESIINLVKYSFKPKDKNEVMEGCNAKIMKLKLYHTNI